MQFNNLTNQKVKQNTVCTFLVDWGHLENVTINHWQLCEFFITEKQVIASWFQKNMVQVSWLTLYGWDSRHVWSFGILPSVSIRAFEYLSDYLGGSKPVGYAHNSEYLLAWLINTWFEL